VLWFSNAVRVDNESTDVIAIRTSNVPKPANSAARDPNFDRPWTEEGMGVSSGFSVICTHPCPVVYARLPSLKDCVEVAHKVLVRRTRMKVVRMRSPLCIRPSGYLNRGLRDVAEVPKGTRRPI